MASRPMLGDIELQQVQRIDSDQDQLLVRHAVPALEGDFLQGLGRRATAFVLDGVLTGPEVGEGLTGLREKFHAAAPVSFAADIASATRIDQVLIEAMDVREIAGHALRFEYAFLLREFIPPPEPRVAEETFAEVAAAEAAQNDAEAQGDERAEEVSSQIAAGQGDLRVEVSLEAGGDLNQLAVLVEGTSDGGEAVRFTIEEQNDGVFLRQNVPAGNYTVQAFRR